MTQEKGLEKATRIRAYNFLPEDLVIPGLDTDVGEENLDYDPRVLLPISEPMVKSILRFGILQPINIAVVDDQPIVVAGRRRVRHAREANKRLIEAGETTLIKVPCKTVRTDDNGRALLGVTENSHRRNDSPVDEARKAERLTARGADDSDVCNAFGWSIGTLRNRRKLLELSPKVIKLVDQGKLSVSAALELHGESVKRQESVADKITALPKRGQAREAQRRKQTGKPAAGSGEPEKYARPGLRLMSKVIEVNAKEGPELLAPEVVQVMQWVMGQRSASTIRGLSTCLRIINEQKITKKQKKKRKKAPKNHPGSTST